MKAPRECKDDTDASLPTLKKHPKRFEVLPAALLLLKVVVGVGGVIMVTNLALFRGEPPAMYAEHNGRAQLAATPGRGRFDAGNIRHHLRGGTSRWTDEREDATAVHPGIPAAPDTGNQVEAAATPRRLRMLPMEGHRGEWFLFPIARSDENDQNGERPEEGRKDEGSKDWLVNDADADDYGSGYHANYAHLDDDESTISGHGWGQRKITVGGRREQHEDEEEKPKGLKTLFTNNGYHTGNGGRIVPGRGWGQAKEEGGIDTKSERAGLRQYDGHLGISKGKPDAMEMSSDHDGRKHREQGTLTKNLYVPLTDEAEVPQSRRRFRHESWEDGNYMSEAAWLQSENDQEVPGTWDTDYDFSMHVTHYSRAAKGNQDMPPAAADLTRRRRQWERERASLWDTDDDVLLFEEAYHHLGAAGDATNDNAVVGMPAAPVHKESWAWESWVTSEPDEFSLYDVSGVSSEAKENGKAADKQFGGWQYDDDFERHDYHSSKTSRDGSGVKGPGVTDDWEVDGGTHFFEAEPMFAAVEDGHGGHATASDQGEVEEGEEEEEDDDLAFGSMFDYYKRFAYDRDEIPAAAAAAAAVLQAGIGEWTDEEERASTEPYTEYYSYLAEMKQLLQQESLERLDADVQQQRQQQPSKRHGVKITDSVVVSEQQERPFEKQEKEGGRLGRLENALLEALSRAEKGGSLGFLEALLPPKRSGGRDEASSRVKAREEPQA